MLDQVTTENVEDPFSGCVLYINFLLKHHLWV